MNILEFLFEGMTLLIHIIHLSIFLGIIHYKPKWIPIYQDYVRIFIGILLIIIFFPAKKIRTKGWVYLYKYLGITQKMVYSLGFSSGIILLTSFMIDHSNKD